MASAPTSMDSTGDRYITARVVDTTSSTIVVADAGGALAPVYVALNGQTQGFVVYDFHTGDNTTGGTWTEGPGYNSMLGLTRFTDSTASFAAFMLGWTVILDVEKPSFLTIFGVPPGGLSVEVRGDATGLGASGATYRVIAPPGVDPTTGALSKPASVLSKRADNRGCMWLWSGYQYVPPQVGHDVSGTTYGAQGGINKLGSYYCWNRTYDVFMGRWTTPDPAATPWGNLWDYCRGRPIYRTDPSGLDCSLKIYTYSSGDSDDLSEIGGSSHTKDYCLSANKDRFIACFKDKLAAGCACISSVIIVGHGGSGLGGFVKADDLTDEEKHFLRYAMCSGASAEIRKCGAYDSAAEMMLLTVLLGGDDHMSEAGIAWHGDCKADGSSVGGGKTRHWWVPRDAGLSGADLKAVNQLNRDIDRCIDTRNESIARGVLTIEAINHMYQHCADKAWADYRKARQGVKGEAHGD